MELQNLENLLNTINLCINIDRDRQRYTQHYDYLKNTIFKIIREYFPVLSNFLNGFQLGGMYEFK